MNLSDLKNLFSNVPDDHILQYGISEPFSWRGSYDEVCFAVEEYVTGKQCKERIQKAYEDTFHGWKGGEFTYTDTTPVNFEHQSGAYTDEGYTKEMIEKVSEYKWEDVALKLSRLLAES